MKKVFLTLAVVAMALTACKSEKKEKVEVKEEVVVEKIADVNNVDVASSVITWKGTKPGGAHDGVIMLKEGSLLLEEGKLSGGEFTIDMASIKNTDLDAETGAKLVEHLINPDFFDVAKFPTSKFVISSVEEKEGVLHVTGNLTLKDVTKSITIPAKLMTEGNVTTFKSETFIIDRADFNVKYGSKSFFDNLKDKFIDDNMEISFEVKTK